MPPSLCNLRQLVVALSCMKGPRSTSELCCRSFYHCQGTITLTLIQQSFFVPCSWGTEGSLCECFTLIHKDWKKIIYSTKSGEIWNCEMLCCPFPSGDEGVGLYLQPSFPVSDSHMADIAAGCGIGCSLSSNRVHWLICCQIVMWNWLSLLGWFFFFIAEPLILSLSYLLPGNSEKIGQKFNNYRLCVSPC